MIKPVIVLEFNELSPRLMAKFIEAGQLPNFARLRSDSQCFVTDAEESPPNLEPWIQWITAHTGLSFSEHGVFNLGDSNRLEADAVWDIASRHGQTVWVCGSMNASYRNGVKGWILPDPWSVNVRPNDPVLEPYFDFVRSQVLEYTREKARYPLAEAMKFAGFMVGHGLRARTGLATLGQLVRERQQDVKWQRPTILDRFQFDVFRHGYLKQKPVFSTLFLNSTAHFQHCYWRNLEPEVFQLKPGEAEQAVHADSVLFGYQSMDRIVGEVLDMVNGDAIVVLATALSQQPCLTYDDSGGKTFYKPDDFSKLLAALGIDPSTCSAEPVMSEEFHVRFSSEIEAAGALEKFRSATVDGREAFRCRREGDGLFAGCAIFTGLPPDAEFQSNGTSRKFFDLFYAADTMKSGMHHPHGLFWLRIPGEPGVMHEDPIPLIDVAPTLLGLLGLPAPGIMRGTPRVPREDFSEQKAVA